MGAAIEDVAKNFLLIVAPSVRQLVGVGDGDVPWGPPQCDPRATGACWRLLE